MWQVSFQMDVQLVSKHVEKVCIIKTTEFWTWIKALERISHVQRYKIRERLLGKSGFDANLTPTQYLLWNGKTPASIDDTISIGFGRSRILTY
jgi:hypothetical protein